MLWFSGDCKEPKSPFVPFSQLNALATGATVMTYSLPTTQEKLNLKTQFVFGTATQEAVLPEDDKVTQ